MEYLGRITVPSDITNKNYVDNNAPTGGHKILNSDGTEMHQRPSIQFQGVDITDDPVLEKTVIEPQCVEVSEEQWDLMTDEEKLNPNKIWLLPWKNEGGGGGGGSADFPPGGITGQALVKASDDDNDVEWGDTIPNDISESDLSDIIDTFQITQRPMPEDITQSDLQDIKDAFEANNVLPIPSLMTGSDLDTIKESFAPNVLDVPQPLTPQDLQDIKDAFVIN